MIDEAQKEWVYNAIEKGYTYLQVKKKLQGARYSPKLMGEVLDFYEKIVDELKKVEDSREEVRNVEEEKNFEGNVKTFLSGNEKELSRSEKRAVKKFLKNMELYKKTLKLTIDKIKLEIESLSKDMSSESFNKEMDYLKKEIINTILDSTSAFDIVHPITREEVTKENLSTLDMNGLIKLMEDNVKALNLEVNGKTEE